MSLQQTAQVYGWHWQVGLKSDILFRLKEEERWQALAEVPLQPGQREYLQEVILTKEHAFGPINLIAAWPVHNDHALYGPSISQPINKAGGEDASGSGLNRPIAIGKATALPSKRPTWMTQSAWTGSYWRSL